MIDIADIFKENPIFYLILIAVVSLFVGSFLNVVIYRLPRMLKSDSAEQLNLSFPLSHCPLCKRLLKPWHYIPVFSYIFLKGKCAYCHGKISIRYPLVELLCCVVSVFIAWIFGVSIITLVALILAWILICLVFICIDAKQEK